MVVIHLVRHGLHADVGQILSGRSSLGLNTSGRDQAERLGKRLENAGIEAIHTSPCRRAVETAQRISLACSLPLQIDQAFDEIDFGSWSGRSFAELASDLGWLQWNEARETARPPGGETMNSVIDRAISGIMRLAATSFERVVVVSHADVIRGIIAHYLGLSVNRLLGFDVAPASVSRVQVGEWGGHVLSVNEDWT
jgi:broad specificity phosphatase PhoE